jgi:HEAT repeat protein
VSLHVLTFVALALYGVTAALLIGMLVRRALVVRRVRAHTALVESLRGPFEEWILDGTQIRRLDERGKAAVLDLAVRYAASMRGAEALRITRCVEAMGLAGRLLDDLKARDEWCRARAADLLGRLAVRGAVPALIAALKDDSEDVRTVAARSLAIIGDAAAVPALAGALADPSRWTVSIIAEDLMRMGPMAVPPLLFLLAASDHNVRVAAVQIIGEIRDPLAVDPLVAVASGDRDLNLRAQAAAALGKLGGPKAERALERALTDEAWQVRAQAAKALGRLGRTEAAPLLAKAMPDVNWWVRLNCAEALARLGAVGRRELEGLLEHPDRYVRERAAAVLATWSLQSVTP